MAEALEKILQEIRSIEQDFLNEIRTVHTAADAEKVRIAYLSRKGRAQGMFSRIGAVEPRQRPELGAELNRLRAALQDEFQNKLKALEAAEEAGSGFDVSLPGKIPLVGGLHPLLQVMDEIKQIFSGMGFRIEEGPEIENEYYNFEALNIPEHHPSRDMQDTFYLENNRLLRTHTSPVQIHAMENTKPPIRMIAPGKCFRKDTPDATHSPVFHQVEGLCIDRGVSFADLKGVVQAFAHKLFGRDVRVRFRPSFFPFTEPSAEYDFSCIFCHGKGCRFCKKTGWLEISGAGMVDPAVFKFVDIDPAEYSGYAFGMGVERIALLKYRINDIRIFYENDLRFLNQF